MDRACPNIDQLLAVLEFPENDLRAKAVEEHVSSCASCQSQLSANTTVIAYQGPSKAATDWHRFADEPGCRRVVDAMRAAGSRASVRHSNDSELLSETAHLPQLLGDYQIQGVIAEGGMGLVLAGVKSNQPPVAIKILQQRIMSPSLIARFVQEAELLLGLQHPNIVRAIEHGEWRGTPYLVMERLNGFDVGTIAARLGRVDLSNACEIIRQAAEGIRVLHGRGIIHRDIKPANLMLARLPDGTCSIKLLDLGLARLEANDANNQLTVTGQVMGTFDYMAPEQAVNSRRVDVRADVYSLGASLWKLLTGLTLAECHPRDCLTAQSSVGALPLKTCVDAVPVELIRILNSWTSVDPQGRVSDVGQIIATLLPWGRQNDLSRLLSKIEHLDSSSTCDTANSLSQTLEFLPECLHGSSDQGDTIIAVSTTRRRWLRNLVIAGGTVGLASLAIKSPFSYRSQAPVSIEPTKHPVELAWTFTPDFPDAKLELKSPHVIHVLHPGERVTPEPATYEILLTLGTAPVLCGTVHVSAENAFSSSSNRTFVLARKTVSIGSLWELSVAGELMRIGPERNLDLEVLDWISSRTAGSATIMRVKDQIFTLVDGRNPRPDQLPFAYFQIDLKQALKPTDDSPFSILAAVSSVKSVAFHQMYLSTPQAERLVRYESLRTLEELTLLETGIEDATWKILTAFENLKKLNVIEEKRAGNSTLEVLLRFAKLYYLHLIGCDVTEIPSIPFLQLSLKHFGVCRSPRFTGSLKTIAKSQVLEELALNRTSINDASLVDLVEMQSLRHIEVGSSQVTDLGMAHLGRIKTLSKVFLEFLPITGKGLRYLQALPLQTLSLEGTQIQSSDLALVNPEELEVLVLTGTPTDDLAIEHLMHMRKLKSLLLKGTRFTPNGVMQLKELLPMCAIEA